MGTGYTRNDTGNNIADGNIINASDLDGEFDAVESAFNSSTGHTHDGTSAEGGPITKLGPVQDLVVSATAVTPKTDNTLDLGSASLEFKDGFFDGTVNIDSLVADTADINGGSVDGVTIGTNSAVTDLRVDNIKVDGNTISSTDTNGNINITPNGTGAVAFTTNATFGDNDKAIFGAGSDLQIYHDGSNSYVQDAGTGDLRISGNNVNIMNGAATENYIVCTNNGSVAVKYDNATKLETTSSGIDVTGNINVGDNHIIGDDANDNLTISSSSGEFVILEGDGGFLLRQGASATNAIRVASGGDISFYDSTGVTQGFFWDADQQRLGLGTTTPTRLLDIESNVPVIRLTDTTTSGLYHEILGDGDSLSIEADDGNVGSSSSINFKVGGTQRMTIDSSGNVGIGTTSPDSGTPLHVRESSASLGANTGASAFLVERAGNVGMTLGTANTGECTIFMGDTDELTTGRVQYDNSDDSLQFWTNASERMRIDSSGLVDILGGSVELNGNELNGISVTIADDAVASMTFPTRQGGFLFLTCEGQSGFPQIASYSYVGGVDFGTSPLGATAIFSGTDVSINNISTPTGTTGSDGDITIFLAGTAGTLYVENRTGTSRTWQVTLM